MVICSGELDGLKKNISLVGCDENKKGAAVLIDAPEDDQALLQAMQRIVQDNKLQDTLIARGLERAKKYSSESMAKKMLSLYDRLLSMQGVSG